jgi:DHA1 family bicyclomycin/chloramphenicol resistance-like MFS transporter
MTFVALAVLNAFTLTIALLLEETLPAGQRVHGSTLQSIFGLAKVVRNPVFTNLLLVGGILTAPFMAYIAVASYVYINEFHTSETMFSFYFAVTSAFAVVGPTLYARFGQKPFKTVLWICAGIAVIAGMLLTTIGKTGPILFLISYLPFAMMTTYIRPYFAELLLNAQQANIGAASATMNFGFTILGSLGMFVGSLQWPSYVSGIAFTIFIFTAAAMVIFVAADKLNVFPKIGSTKPEN